MAETKPTVGVLQTFVGIVADATEWLAGLLGDDGARRAVLSDLGLAPVDGVEVDEKELLTRVSGDLTAVRTYAEANVDQADAAALVSAIEAIANIVDVMAGQIEIVTSSMPEGRRSGRVRDDADAAVRHRPDARHAARRPTPSPGRRRSSATKPSASTGTASASSSATSSPPSGWRPTTTLAWRRRGSP